MINRQLETIYILMKKGTVTAEELAEHFEVSTRTVYRDIDSLSMAGIPVYASRGKGGGIRLMERFVLDKLLLSREEQRRILAALASLRETGASGDGKTLEKLKTFFKAEPLDWVSIDFSDWSGRRGDLFGQIREAILGRHVMTFDYYGQYGDMTHREAEPVQLLFKEYTWYVKAFCRVRGAMRLFKVLRMKRVEIREETFEPGERHLEKQEDREAGKAAGSGTPGKTEESAKTEDLEDASKQKNDMPLGPADAEQAGHGTEVVFRIERKEAYRVYDRFEEEEITVLPQGDFEIRMWCMVDDWVYGLLLSFGPSARVLGPGWVREELERRIRRMAEIYGS
ncbi:MAG TPA: YafY family transcriptional regulator [Lachnospiraceae bacterium]|nr:YafY family transcriptional regulator [Lachnospiraceae bacterium]